MLEKGWARPLEIVVSAWRKWPRNPAVIMRLYRLADGASAHWPMPPHKGQRIGTVTYGERGNSADICKGCGKVIGGGAHDPLRHLDDDAFHVRNLDGRTCYAIARWSRRHR
jgi:hypothetical protein